MSSPNGAFDSEVEEDAYSCSRLQTEDVLVKGGKVGAGWEQHGCLRLKLLSRAAGRSSSTAADPLQRRWRTLYRGSRGSPGLQRRWLEEGTGDAAMDEVRRRSFGAILAALSPLEWDLGKNVRACTGLSFGE